MLRLKADSGKLSHDLFADISTRSLNSVIVGESCGKISSGKGNAFVGFECGNQNMEGSFGVFVGFQAGQFNKNGNWNTFVGSYTGRQNSRGDKNTFVGFRAGELNLDGSECTAIGVNAMRENSVGNRNVAVGISAGERILEGDNNTMIGAEAGQNIRSGNLNTMAGYRSGRGAFRGNENTYFGAYSGYSNGLGDGNSFIGYKSGEYLTEGNYNVGVGAYTLQQAQEGSCNIAIGAFSGSYLSGTGNVLVGTGAATNTSNGNFNTVLGTNTGFNANGDNNVYIGYEAAKNTIGDKNVVIGSSAFSRNNSSNSVVIGYNSADTVFQNGSNNIFIGTGADSHTSRTSFAIAIGSANTRAGTKSISVGEDINNGGMNSVLLGYNLYSDSDQCVSIGYESEINNVIVFNDPLNYIFPVNTITNYRTFNLRENYTDMLYLNDVSNTVAIATVNSSNVYDSGYNLLKGVVRETKINLLNIFPNNIIYHNITVFNDSNTTLSLPDPYFENVVQLENEVPIVDGMTEYILPVPIANIQASNLIPIDPLVTTSLDYRYFIGRRIAIDTLSNNRSYSVPDNKLAASIFITNIQKTPLVVAPFERSNFFPTTNNRYLITQYPLYGDLEIQNDTLRYIPYPEALFASNDTFSMTFATTLGDFTIIPENTPVTDIDFINKTYPAITNINLHQQKKTVLDSNILGIESFDENILIEGSNIQIIHSNVPVTDPLILSDGRVFTCTYLPILQNPLSYSNITLVTDTFSLEETIVPFQIDRIVQHPKYGVVENGSYKPNAFNFTQDTFVALSSNDTLFTVNVLTDSGGFKANKLNKIQTPVVITYDSNVYTNCNVDVKEVPLFISFSNIYKRIEKVSFDVDAAIIYADTKIIETYNILQDTPYIQKGYIHTCNLIMTDTVVKVEYDSISDIVLTSNDGVVKYTYYIYNPVTNNPAFFLKTYDWDYANPSTFNETNAFPTQLPALYIPQSRVFSNVNNLVSNEYFYIFTVHDTLLLYKEASNVIIYNSNVVYQNDVHVDTYNNYIYNDRHIIPQNPIITSTFTLFNPELPFKELHTEFSFSNDIYYTSNIPTIQLQDTLFYDYDGIYNASSSNKLPILKKNKGVVTSFHQSNVTNKEIHIWDKNNTGSNLYLNDNILVDIDYYSNIESGIADTYPSIDFIKGIYDTGLSNNIIIHTSNISFLDSNVCVSDGDIFINYINSNTNQEIQTHIPSSYLILNQIDLNIGLKTTNTTKLKRTDLFFYYNSQEIHYTIIEPYLVKFYKNNVATFTFTQTDINNGLITIECFRDADQNFNIVNTSTTHVLKIRTYIQNAYLPQTSSNTTSNTIIQGIHSFMGSIWEDLDKRSEDPTIYILNNPVNGFLYSSNTESVVNTIQYSDFKNDTIYYIPYTPSNISIDNIDIFFSYSNVSSPIYTIPFNSEWSRIKTLENITQRVNFGNTNVSVRVDESSYTYFNALLNDFQNRDVTFYIVKPPLNGVILNKRFLSVPYFTSADIISKNVFYQNYQGSTIDSFEIKVGTNMYALSSNTATVSLEILPLPELLSNNYSYIYGCNLQSARTSYNRLGSNLLDISSGGIYIYDKELLDVFVKDTSGNYTSRDYFLKGEDVYYRPKSEFFEFNSNENKTMKMKFFTYSNTDIREPNPLSVFDAYSDIYKQEWFSKYNTFDSANEFISIINPNQSISYTRDVRDVLFEDKKCKIQFDYRPFQTLLDIQNFGEEYNDFLKTYKYNYKLIDFDDNVIIEIDFQDTSTVVKIGSRQIIIPKEGTIFDWNRFYMINNDDTNDEKLSIYINDINYTSYRQVSVESLDLSSLKQIIITVPILDVKNLYTGTLFRDIIDSDLKLYYNLQKYNTTLYFKNFELLLGGSDTIDSTAYNIAIGDYLRVNGFNNICIGKNFLTTGTGSIIIGNDIGSTPDRANMSSQSFNEIFNSIIVSTSSFVQTKVRDVIAIGNNILNRAGGDAKIDLFFSKKPVLIGNNITTKTIDFHINIQNTFLKTDVGHEQIYCGLENEAVCIGYSSNEECDNRVANLYVNGNAFVSGQLIQRSADKYFTRYFYPSREFKNTYVMNVAWDYKPADPRDTVTLDCKFKFVAEGLTLFGYYNFESVISTSNITQLYTIPHSSSGNISHSVEPSLISNAITLKIIWNSDLNASLLANMEVESVSSGNLVFA